VRRIVAGGLHLVKPTRAHQASDWPPTPAPQKPVKARRTSHLELNDAQHRVANTALQSSSVLLLELLQDGLTDSLEVLKDA